MKQSQTNIIVRVVTVPQSIVFFAPLLGKLQAEGFTPVVISSPGPALDALHAEQQVHCIALPMERHISPLRDVKSLIGMIRILRRLRPQIIHSMTPKAGLISMLAGWITRVPLRIHTFTGLVWPTATGLKRCILMATDALTCAAATHVIPEGQGVMHDLQRGHITHKPLRVLGYGNVKGVEMSTFDPSRFPGLKPNEDTKFTFLFVGRIVCDKGVAELVQAFGQLYTEFPQVQLVLVGAFESDLDPLDQATMDKIQNHPGIILAGEQRGEDLLRHYAASHCFVMPSYREGFPNTVLEAGAMGLPLIVTDINGSREIITHRVNGLIVPPRTVEPLLQAMRTVLTDKDLRQRMIAQARPMIAERFDSNYVQQCQLDFYREITHQLGM